MSTPELVTVTIDGREVQVPKGTGLVETALAAGIEIPVFCYEPRLGPAIGACRMCLVEVEGMPKVQAACVLTAQDGMVVATAQSSAEAAEAQNATLEFILVNHPLDCPICDKGGECPLQDLTFRWGPAATRMEFPKRTFEKPIPISPTIALDRERCILCYRCTRFSEAVAEDGQLVAENRGAQSVIATFEDEPYRAPFSGNVIELCPVGALTSTQYRFEARPWEVQNVPTVCGMCPVGCNIHASTREGKVRRILSRNHPEVDQGWLCDKGRFAFSHVHARDRLADPLHRVGAQRYEEIPWDTALDEFERLLREARGRTVTALSGSETVEMAYALGKLLRKGLGAHTALLPENVNPVLGAFRAPLSAIGDAEIVVVLGDDPVVERAPIVDLWIRLARRRGAEVVTATENEARENDRLRDSDRVALIWSGPGGAVLTALAADLRLHEKPGSAAFHLPQTANGRGIAQAWAAAADEEDENPEPIGLLIVSGDEAVANPDVRALAYEAEAVVTISMFRAPVVPWTNLIIPGTSYLERDGTYVNLEGRLQRLRRAVIPPAPDELAWIAKLAERFDVDLSPHAPVVFAELSAMAYDGLEYGLVGEHAPLPRREELGDLPKPAKTRAARGKGLRLVSYRPLFSGPAVDRVPELEFQRPAAEVELSPADARRLKVKSGQVVKVRSNGTSIELRARVSRQLRAGTVRVPADHARGLGTHVEIAR